MCFSKPPDPSAELRRQEAERQARVAEGTQRIDATFAPFNDDFYNARKQAEMDYYLPQVEDQYKKSYQDAVARLANSGNLTSTAGASLLGDINKQYELSKQGVLDQAAASGLRLKSDMSQNRARLIELLSGGSSIGSVADSAAAMAQANLAPATYSPLGNLFAGIGNTIAMSNLANAVNAPAKQYDAPGLATGNKAGSKSVVTYGG